MVVDPDDRDTCWCWTGAFQAPRLRRRLYTSEGDHEIFRHTNGCNVRERGTPMLHNRELGYPVAAHRQLYATATEQPLATVPRLQRCHNDRCVRPGHMHELDAVPEKARGRTKGGMPLGDALQEPVEPPSDLWGLLTGSDRPSAQLSKPEVEEEVGQPIPDAMYRRWLAWDAEQPDED